jgi:hypothetical protein
VNPLSPEKSSYRYAERDWDSLTAELHTSSPPSDVQIKSFVMAMIGLEPGAETFGISVCSAKFVKIAGSEVDSLVASVDYNGRHFCNDVYVIHRGADGLVMQDANNLEKGVQSYQVNDVDDIVRDLCKDGKNELVIPTGYSDYDGARCLANWTRIYIMQSDSLVERSKSFSEYYKGRLSTLLNEVMPQAKIRDADDGEARAICVQMEIDKIERFLSISPSAGEDRAVGWINSTDLSLRLKGIAVLADIRDKKSTATLQHFTKDSDAIVADAAKRALATSQDK